MNQNSEKKINIWNISFSNKFTNFLILEPIDEGVGVESVDASRVNVFFVESS